MPEANVIQEIIAPAAMIPACGLLLLSSTSRMNTVLARIRAFHNEMLDVWCLDETAATRRGKVRTLRLEGLDEQTTRLIRRARLLRLTMLQLFGAIACNLVAVIGLAFRFVIEESDHVYTAAVVIFIVGVGGMLGSMATSFLEVRSILTTVLFEHDRVGGLVQSDPAELDGPVGPRPSSGEGLGL
ncbi:MAG: DUF2721 domain-containing protein [Planctomycetota bacterium]